MTITYLCPVIHLKLEFRNAYTYPDNTTIQQSSQAELYDLIRSREAIFALGGIYLSELERNLHFCRVDTVTSTLDNTAAEKVKADFELRLFFLWLIRDNSCNALQLIGIDKNTTAYTSISNRYFSNAKGLYEEAGYSADEVSQAFDYCLSFHQVAIPPEKAPDIRPDIQYGNVVPSRLSFVNYNVLNRIGRAFSFLQAARLNSLLPAKISYYVLFLECLFSGDDVGEIQHKIAQRIANYIGGDAAEKKRSFDFIKTTYRVRSKYLHGQKLSKGTITREQLLPISTELDELIRKLFLKILVTPDPFLLESEELKEWLDSQMF